MALRILSSPSEPADLAAQLRAAIAEALPGATIDVTPNSPGHYQIRVVAQEFAGKNRVQQQQLVYRAIAPLMRGDAAPVHAIDLLQTELP
jgi:acid stress-induced BolA-like protein IbaG/YrbA